MSVRSTFETFDDRIDSYQAMTRRETRNHSADRDALGWKHFAAAAGATLAGAASTGAAVVHVVPPSPIQFALGSNSVEINLDGDGDNDLVLNGGIYTSGIYYTFIGRAFGTNGVQLIADNSYGDVRKFAMGAPIPAVAPTLTGGYLRTSKTVYNNHISFNGNWGTMYQPGDVGIAGFVDGVGASARAGWIKIQTHSIGGALGAISVLEWAYQTVPGMAITAGQTSSGPVLGDYNNNGSVGPEDYTTWKAAYGNTTLPNSNNDGIVDAVDYTVWRNNLGNPGSGTGGLAEAVPEPVPITLGVLALGAAGLAALRRRKN